MNAISAAAALAAWEERDKRTIVSPQDGSAIDGALSARALVVELALHESVDEELYDACASLGRLMGRSHGSPTLASATIDHLSEAVGAPAPWLAGAKAAFYEGFSATLDDMARAEALLAWEFPRCAIPVGIDSIAIAAGHPADERDVLKAWAARAAISAAQMGVRRAMVSGPFEPRRAMAEALSVVGIDVDQRSFNDGTPAYEGSRT